jgi:hypothetical protein
MKKFLLLSLIAFSATTLVAQQTNTDWLSMMKDGKTNVHNVQKAFYAWYATHKNEATEMDGKETEDCAYNLFKRWEHMMVPRTYPSGNYPDPAMIAALYSNMIRKNNTNRTAQTQSFANWSYVGNDSVPTGGGGDGRVNRVRFYPGNNNIIYACAPTGGLWKSTNGGATWSTNTDLLSELGTSDLAIDPGNPNIMYLATGDCDGPGADFHSISTIGVLKTTDGGNTWNSTGLSYNQSNTGPSYGTVTELALNPNNTNIILAATSAGMYYSSNAGTSWTQEDTEYFKSVEFEPFHPSVVFAATGDGKFFRSTDGGMTYTQITSGLPATGLCGRGTVAVTPADSTYVYVIFEDQTTKGYHGLYRSTNKGVTFSLMSNTGPNGLSISYGWYGLPLAVSPTNRDSVLAGGLDVYLSTNGGTTWAKNASWTGSGAPYAHADGHHYIFTPGTGASWFDACDGGIFKATNHGAIYTDLSHNLHIAEIYAMGASSLTPGLNISGWQDNGTSISGNPWQQVNGGDGMVPFIDFSNDNTMYSASQGGALYVSFNGGASWSGATGGITESIHWLTCWLQDPLSANTLFAGFSNVWKSVNQGSSWVKISHFATTSSTVNALIVDPSNDQVLYAAWPDSVFTTTNQTTWKNITANLPVSQAYITGLALDPNNYNHAWVTFSGYVDSVKVFQTYNGGLSWKNISIGLPNLPVNCVLFQKNSYSGIYVGTDCGIYYRDTITNSWTSYNTGLPNVIVNDLKYDASGALLAASYGRGIWSSPVYLTGINTLAPNNAFKIYPNPSSGKFTMQSSVTNGKSSIEVYNMLGEKVYTGNLNSTTTEIDLSNQSQGVYLYRMLSETGNLIAEGKLIIQK